MLDTIACRSFLIRRLHPAGPRCPDCGTSPTGLQSEAFNAGGRVHCRSCGRWFSWRTGSILQGSTLDERQLYLVVFLTSAGCPVSTITEASGLPDRTVRDWQHRLREACQP